jgi:hypothetical protein
MRVEIGPYVNWFGPYQLAEKLCFWVKPKKDEDGFKSVPEWVHNFGTWLAEDENGNDSKLTKFLSWIDSKRKRKIYVRIDNYDLWNMDQTLAIIILPMLKKFRKEFRGAPFVDDEDVPENLRSTNSKKDEEGHLDANHHRRWEWVLDEMIWAFEQLHPSSNWEDQFSSGKIDLVSEPVSWDADGNVKEYKLVRGPEHTYKFDAEGAKKHQERIKRGTLLFGKYFQNLSN